MFMQTLHKRNKMKKRFLYLLQGLFLFLGINLNAFTYNIVNGDQMLGAVENISDFTPFQNKCVNFIYYIDFPNDEQYYVRNINAVVSGYPLLTQLNKGQGFILNASGSCSVTLSTQDEIIFKGLTYKTITSQQTGRIWLDRNLGATKVCDKYRYEFSSNLDYANSQRACFGDYYQWGRKTDGHQIVTSTTTATLQNLTNTNSLFSYNDNPRYDWVPNTSDTYGNNRRSFWNLDTGANDAICPPNFRVPTVSEWADEALDYYTVTNIMKIPYSGYRIWNNGSLIVEGDYTKLWTQTPYDNLGAKALTYSNSYLGVGNSESYERRATGMPVRCIKKQ